MAAPVAVAVTPPGGAQVTAGPVSVGVIQPNSAQILSAPVSVTCGPVVTAVSPASGHVGTSVSVTISGGNLGGASAVHVLKDGLADTTVTVVPGTLSAAPDGTSVTCTLSIGSTALTGSRVLRVATSHGESTNLNIGTNVFTVQP